VETIANDSRKKSMKEFVEHWTDKGYEKDELQKFGIELLQNRLSLTIHLSLTSICYARYEQKSKKRQPQNLSATKRFSRDEHLWLR